MTDQDAEVRQLCLQIYRNHKRAIDLINNELKVPGSPVLAAVASCLKQREKQIDHIKTKNRSVSAIPINWCDALPKIQQPTWGPWLRFHFDLRSTRLIFRCIAYPTIDSRLRRAIIERLVSTPEFGFKTQRKRFTDKWTRLCSERVLAWGVGEEPGQSDVINAVNQKLDNVLQRLAGVPDVIRDVTDQGKLSE